MTLEAVSHHAETAQQNIDRAGLAERVTILQGKALDTLSQLKEQDTLPFDLIFIDADKPNNPQYLKWALHFSKGNSHYCRQCGQKWSSSSCL